MRRCVAAHAKHDRTIAWSPARGAKAADGPAHHPMGPMRSQRDQSSSPTPRFPNARRALTVLRSLRT